MQKEREENLLATSLCHRKMWAARLQQLPFVLKFTNLVLAQFVNKARRGSIASVMGLELRLATAPSFVHRVILDGIIAEIT